MLRAKENLKEILSKVPLELVYILLGIGTILSYKYAISLMAIQSAWINTVMGKASVSTLLLLFMWIYFIEKEGKKRNWKSKKIWALMLAGVMILVMSVYYTPL